MIPVFVFLIVTMSPLAGCLVITPAQIHLENAFWLSQFKNFNGAAEETDKLLEELARYGGYMPPVRPCILTTYREPGLDGSLARIFSQFYKSGRKAQVEAWLSQIEHYRQSSPHSDQRMDNLWYAVGSYLFEDKEYALALRFFEKVISKYDLASMDEESIRKNGYLSQSIEYAVKCWMSVGKESTAERLLRTLLARYEDGVSKRDFDRPTYQRWLAELLAAKASCSEAEQLLKDNITHYEKQKYDYHIDKCLMELGTFYLKSQQPVKATEIFERLVGRLNKNRETQKLSPQLLTSWLWGGRQAMLALASAYEKVGRVKDAEHTYQKLLEISHNSKDKDIEFVLINSEYVPFLERQNRGEEAQKLRTSTIQLAKKLCIYCSLANRR
jgi:tetratricopeptide (TPR) repeat protein